MGNPTSERLDRSRHIAHEDYQPNGDGARASEDWLWSAAGSLLLWTRFIVGVTVLIAIAAVVIALRMPNWYGATARVLAPAQSTTSALAGAVMRSLPSAAMSMLGGKGGDYARYLTILSSRRMYESVVDSFNLADVYGIPKSEPNRREIAVGKLGEYVSFPVDAEYEYLSISVLDTDPKRAADMANFMVRRLNGINAELSSQNAGSYRKFIEARYRNAELSADSLLDAVQAFQKRYGLFDVTTQTEQFFAQVAQLRANAIQAEIEHESMLARLGPDNSGSGVEYLADAARIANRKYQEALAGQEQLLPVAQSEMSGVLRQYLDLKREGETQARILEVVRPMLEQARFDEQRQVEALQIVDAATPPLHKAKPRRSILVVLVTLSGFALAVTYVLLYEWWRKRHAYVTQRLRRAMRESEQARTQPVSTP